MLVAAQAGLLVEEYAPNEVKQAIDRHGQRGQAQVQDALARIHGLREVPTQPDAADAVAVGLTHLLAARMRGSPRGRASDDRVPRGRTGREGRRDVSCSNVAGVGYELAVPTSVLAALPPVGERARLHTRMVVREDAMTLYGFGSTDERELFDLLTGVTGVGPKVGLAFLSALQPDALRRAVVAGDADTLTVVPGVGKKVAQRVVLDLRDKLGGEARGDRGSGRSPTCARRCWRSASPARRHRGHAPGSIPRGRRPMISCARPCRRWDDDRMPGTTCRATPSTSG